MCRILLFFFSIPTSIAINLASVANTFLLCANDSATVIVVSAWLSSSSLLVR